MRQVLREGEMYCTQEIVTNQAKINTRIPAFNSILSAPCSASIHSFRGKWHSGDGLIFYHICSDLISCHVGLVMQVEK